MYTDYNNLYSSYLSHSGKKGMKWGIRNKKKLNKFENKKVNISDDKKQQDKLLKLYKQRKEANWYAANALIAAAITVPIGALMTTSYNSTIAKAGEALITSSGLAAATAGAYAGQSISLKNEQKRLQARYGHSLDESNMKYHPLKGTISYGQKGK